MTNTWKKLRNDVQEIWQAGVAAVDSQRLVEQAVQLENQLLFIQEEPIDLSAISRIVVVGAGKAGAGMAAGLETVLGGNGQFSGCVEGWINVPADCARTLESIHLHAARPAGLNEPTQDGVRGSEQILKLVASLAPTDLCICLFSGGGSALLPAPLSGIELTDKQEVTQFLSAAGANIEQLNTVRKQLSTLKGGRLAGACQANRLISLIISDVPGDPLDIIASGPTVTDSSSPQDAIEILDVFNARQFGQLDRVYHVLRSLTESSKPTTTAIKTRVSNYIIGNNQLAVEAASKEAQRRGYQCQTAAALNLEGPAEEVGRQLSQRGLQMKEESVVNCLISGGEPTVQLVPVAQRGKGGRNQQLVLAALDHQFRQSTSTNQPPPWQGMALLSGGTDGEDGPTDAAGAYVDQQVVELVRQQGLNPREHLARNDAYPLFEAVEALVKTGPTHTNVCDLRVLLIDRR